MPSRARSILGLLLLSACDGTGKPGDGSPVADTACVETTWYADADGDGAGDATGATRACLAPDGAVDDATDCDDADAEVHPGAVERCNGLDDDCDGVIDEDLADVPTWYADADGDGYGDATASTTACVAPDGYVADATDCDDAAADVHPGATEIPEDGRDEDCDGTPEVESLVGAACTLIGEAGGDEAGTALAGGGDVNGDGWPDVVVGAAQHGAINAGAAYLVYGSRSGTVNLGAADARILGDEDYGYVGDAVAAAGDLDGDGFDDMVVGAYLSGAGVGYGGAVYVFRGGGAAGDRHPTDADAAWLGASVGQYLGASVAYVGDTDGDGGDDLLIGAVKDSTGGSWAGAAFLVRGSDGWASVTDAAVALWGEDANDLAGGAVAAAGDIDGDGLADLAVGAVSDDDGGTQAGAVYVIYAASFAASIDLSAADVKLTGAAASDGFGGAIAGGRDVDGDGHDDLLIGAESADARGRAYLFRGPLPSGGSASDAALVFEGDDGDDRAGGALALLADTGGGLPELAVGAYDAGAGSEGRVYLLHGDASGSLTSADAFRVLGGVARSDWAGITLADAGDWDGDGSGDVLVGAYGVDDAASEVGAAYVVTSF